MTSLRRLIVRALDTACPSVESLAARMGLSTSALRYYRLGKREPSGDTVLLLASELRRQAEDLVKMAGQLEEQSTKQGGKSA